MRVLSGVNDSGAIEAADGEFATKRDDGKGINGDAEAEGLTVALSSFLLDICQRRREERMKVVSKVKCWIDWRRHFSVPRLKITMPALFHRRAHAASPLSVVPPFFY